MPVHTWRDPLSAAKTAADLLKEALEEAFRRRGISPDDVPIEYSVVSQPSRKGEEPVVLFRVGDEGFFIRGAVQSPFGVAPIIGYGAATGEDWSAVAMGQMFAEKEEGGGFRFTAMTPIASLAHTISEAVSTRGVSVRQALTMGIPEQGKPSPLYLVGPTAPRAQEARVAGFMNLVLGQDVSSFDIRNIMSQLQGSIQAGAVGIAASRAEREIYGESWREGFTEYLKYLYPYKGDDEVLRLQSEPWMKRPDPMKAIKSRTLGFREEVRLSIMRGREISEDVPTVPGAVVEGGIPPREYLPQTITMLLTPLPGFPGAGFVDPWGVLAERDEQGRFVRYTPHLPSLPRMNLFRARNVQDVTRLTEIAITSPEVFGRFHAAGKQLQVGYLRFGDQTIPLSFRKENAPFAPEAIEIVVPPFFHQRTQRLALTRPEEGGADYIDLPRYLQRLVEEGKIKLDVPEGVDVRFVAGSTFDVQARLVGRMETGISFKAYGIKAGAALPGIPLELTSAARDIRVPVNLVTGELKSIDDAFLAWMDRTGITPRRVGEEVIRAPVLEFFKEFGPEPLRRVAEEAMTRMERGVAVPWLRYRKGVIQEIDIDKLSELLGGEPYAARMAFQESLLNFQRTIQEGKLDWYEAYQRYGIAYVPGLEEGAKVPIGIFSPEELEWHRAAAQRAARYDPRLARVAEEIGGGSLFDALYEVEKLKSGGYKVSARVAAGWLMDVPLAMTPEYFAGAYANLEFMYAIYQDPQANIISRILGIHPAQLSTRLMELASRTKEDPATASWRRILAGQFAYEALRSGWKAEMASAYNVTPTQARALLAEIGADIGEGPDILARLEKLQGVIEAMYGGEEGPPRGLMSIAGGRFTFPMPIDIIRATKFTHEGAPVHGMARTYLEALRSVLTAVSGLSDSDLTGGAIPSGLEGPWRTAEVATRRFYSTVGRMLSPRGRLYKRIMGIDTALMFGGRYTYSPLLRPYEITLPTALLASMGRTLGIKGTDEQVVRRMLGQLGWFDKSGRLRAEGERTPLLIAYKREPFLRGTLNFAYGVPWVEYERRLFEYLKSMGLGLSQIKERLRVTRTLFEQGFYAGSDIALSNIGDWDADIFGGALLLMRQGGRLVVPDELLERAQREISRRMVSFGAALEQITPEGMADFFNELVASYSDAAKDIQKFMETRGFLGRPAEPFEMVEAGLAWMGGKGAMATRYNVRRLLLAASEAAGVPPEIAAQAHEKSVAFYQMALDIADTEMSHLEKVLLWGGVKVQGREQVLSISMGPGEAGIQVPLDVLRDRTQALKFMRGFLLQLGGTMGAMMLGKWGEGENVERPPVLGAATLASALVGHVPKLYEQLRGELSEILQAKLPESEQRKRIMGAIARTLSPENLPDEELVRSPLLIARFATLLNRAAGVTGLERAPDPEAMNALVSLLGTVGGEEMISRVSAAASAYLLSQGQLLPENVMGLLGAMQKLSATGAPFGGPIMMALSRVYGDVLLRRTEALPTARSMRIPVRAAASIVAGGSPFAPYEETRLVFEALRAKGVDIPGVEHFGNVVRLVSKAAEEGALREASIAKQWIGEVAGRVDWAGTAFGRPRAYISAEFGPLGVVRGLPDIIGVDPEKGILSVVDIKYKAGGGRVTPEEAAFYRAQVGLYTGILHTIATQGGEARGELIEYLTEATGISQKQAQEFVSRMARGEVAYRAGVVYAYREGDKYRLREDMFEVSPERIPEWFGAISERMRSLIGLSEEALIARLTRNLEGLAGQGGRYQVSEDVMEWLRRRAEGIGQGAMTAPLAWVSQADIRAAQKQMLSLLERTRGAPPPPEPRPSGGGPVRVEGPPQEAPPPPPEVGAGGGAQQPPAGPPPSAPSAPSPPPQPPSGGGGGGGRQWPSQGWDPRTPGAISSDVVRYALSYKMLQSKWGSFLENLREISPELYEEYFLTGDVISSMQQLAAGMIQGDVTSPEWQKRLAALRGAGFTEVLDIMSGMTQQSLRAVTRLMDTEGFAQGLVSELQKLGMRADEGFAQEVMQFASREKMELALGEISKFMKRIVGSRITPKGLTSYQSQLLQKMFLGAASLREALGEAAKKLTEQGYTIGTAEDLLSLLSDEGAWLELAPEERIAISRALREVGGPRLRAAMSGVRSGISALERALKAGVDLESFAVKALGEEGAQKFREIWPFLQSLTGLAEGSEEMGPAAIAGLSQVLPQAMRFEQDFLRSQAQMETLRARAELFTRTEKLTKLLDEFGDFLEGATKEGRPFVESLKESRDKLAEFSRQYEELSKEARMQEAVREYREARAKMQELRQRMASQLEPDEEVRLQAEMMEARQRMGRAMGTIVGLQAEEFQAHPLNRLARRLLGGWGLFYMMHLLNFAMTPARIGMREEAALLGTLTGGAIRATTGFTPMSILEQEDWRARMTAATAGHVSPWGPVAAGLQNLMFGPAGIMMQPLTAGISAVALGAYTADALSRVLAGAGLTGLSSAVLSGGFLGLLGIGGASIGLGLYLYGQAQNARNIPVYVGNLLRMGTPGMQQAYLGTRGLLYGRDEVQAQVETIMQGVVQAQAGLPVTGDLAGVAQAILAARQDELGRMSEETQKILQQEILPRALAMGLYRETMLFRMPTGAAGAPPASVIMPGIAFPETGREFQVPALGTAPFTFEQLTQIARWRQGGLDFFQLIGLAGQLGLGRRITPSSPEYAPLAQALAAAMGQMEPIEAAEFLGGVQRLQSLGLPESYLRRQGWMRFLSSDVIERAAGAIDVERFVEAVEKLNKASEMQLEAIRRAASVETRARKLGVEIAVPSADQILETPDEELHPLMAPLAREEVRLGLLERTQGMLIQGGVAPTRAREVARGFVDAFPAQYAGILARALSGDRMALSFLAANFPQAFGGMADQFVSVDMAPAWQVGVPGAPPGMLVPTGRPLFATSLRIGGKAPEQVAAEIWGSRWRETDVTGIRRAMVEGVETPWGGRWYGMWAARLYMANLGLEATMASAGYQMQMLQLQREYQMQMWPIQDAISAENYKYQMWMFRFQQQSLEIGRERFYERWGMAVQQFQLGQDYTRSMWSISDQMRALQFQWSVTDIREAMRFATGRERRVLERRLERETVMYNLQEERTRRQRQYQEELWQLEEKRLELSKKYYEEDYKRSQERLERARKHYKILYSLQQQLRDLQRKYFLEMNDLQKRAAAAQAYYAQLMKQANIELMAVGEKQEELAGKARVLPMFLAQAIDIIIDGLRRAAESISGYAPGLPSDSGSSQDSSSGGGGGGGGSGGGSGGSGPSVPTFIPTVRHSGGSLLPGAMAILRSGEIMVTTQDIIQVIPREHLESGPSFAPKGLGAEDILFGGGGGQDRARVEVLVTIGTEELRSLVREIIVEELEG